MRVLCGHPHARPSRCILVFLLMVSSLTTVLLNGSAIAAGYGKNKVQSSKLEWQTLTTPHFDIHFYDGAEELAVRASIIAEQAYQEYAARLDRDLPWRVPFILYTCHNDFAQTNISNSLIGEGTGGFSEPFRNRMVLPYNGSHADFLHVIRHELVHVFMFDMAFGRRGGGVGRSYLFNIPLWFAEGVAEWFSSGWDKEADMFMRDAAINDYLYPLDRIGGFLVYKEGQAAMRVLSECYGPEKLVDFWRMIGRTRSTDRALHNVYGLSMEKMNELFFKTLRQRYWPSYGHLEELEEIARPLTDHVEQRAFFNEGAAISPDGDMVAFFSDREGLVDLYLMSAIDGQIIRQLVRGYRSSTFESFHTSRSAVSFSPDGDTIAVIAKSGNYETLHLIEVADGRTRRSFRLGLDIVSWPAWSPDGETIAVVGTRLGRTDLYLLDLDGNVAPALAARYGTCEEISGGGQLIRITQDIGDESKPAWSPNGTRLAFIFNPAAEIDFEFEIDDDQRKRLLWARPSPQGTNQDSGRLAPGGNVVLLDLASGDRCALFADEGGKSAPTWIDPHTLCVVSDCEGIDNLAMVSLDTTGTKVADFRKLTNVLGGVDNLSYSAVADRLIFVGFNQAGYDIFACDDFVERWSQREPAGQQPGPVTVEPPPIMARVSPPDTLITPEKIGLIEPYRPRFMLDTSQALGGGGVYFNSGAGLGMANMIHLSDLMGDRRLSFLLNFYSSLENSDISMTYYHLKRRINFGVGIFHYSNYYNSVMTSVGELLSDRTLFRERNYGVFGLASYPFNTFERVDLELQILTSDRTNLEYEGFGFVEGPRQLNRLLQPTLSYVSDTAFYGSFGPIAGGRWNASISQSLPLSSSSLTRTTAVFDWRKYWLPWNRNTFAMHLTLAHSSGDDARAFLLGGPWTLRGYHYYDYQTIPELAGPRLLLTSFEYRLPMIDYLVFGWPFQWGFSNIGGTIFFDAGTAWHDKVQLFGDDQNGEWGFRDLRGNWGIGIRTRLGFLPLKFDWAWKTDLRTVGSPIFQFSIGPEF